VTLLEQEQELGIAWCCVYTTQQKSMKILTPTEAIHYGISTLFSSLLTEILRDYNDAGAFVNSREINIAVHVAPSFADTNHFPIPGVDCYVHLFLKDLPAKCVCFTLLEPKSLSSLLPSLPVDSINDRLMANRCVLHLPDKNDTSRALNTKYLTYNKPKMVPAVNMMATSLWPRSISSMKASGKFNFSNLLVVYIHLFQIHIVNYVIFMSDVTTAAMDQLSIL
jgi:hypothetical protein